MREPTIHITKSQLKSILSRVLECSIHKAEDLAEQILVHGRKYSMTHRCLVSTNQQLQRKSDRIKLTSKSEAGLFANMLLICRRKAHHRAIQLIKPGSSDWLMVKEISKLATEFSNEFGLPLKEGYQKYIELGLKKMKLFSLMKYKGFTPQYALNMNPYLKWNLIQTQSKQ